MSGTESFFRNLLADGETLLEVVENVHINLGFVPFGHPMSNIGASNQGSLALTSHRLIVQWIDDVRYKAYSALAVHALSERHFNANHPQKWPYQAILILTGGVSLVVETVDKNVQSAEQLSRFLTKVLFSLGKRENDVESMIAMNAHLEEIRRRQAND